MAKLLSEKQTNIFTGKALVGALTKKEQLQVMEHLNELYFMLDQCDEDDVFGTEGWRHYFDIPEAD